MAGSTVLCHRHLLMIALMTNCSGCRDDQRTAASRDRIPCTHQPPPTLQTGAPMQGVCDGYLQCTRHHRTDRLAGMVEADPLGQLERTEERMYVSVIVCCVSGCVTYVYQCMSRKRPAEGSVSRSNRDELRFEPTHFPDKRSIQRHRERTWRDVGTAPVSPCRFP
jgi:hypothetical protein